MCCSVVPRLWHYWEVQETLRGGGPVGRSWETGGCIPRGDIRIPGPSASSLSHTWPCGKRASSILCSFHDVMPHHRPKAMEPTNYGWNLPKPWARINHFFQNLMITGICCSTRKPTSAPLNGSENSAGCAKFASPGSLATSVQAGHVTHPTSLDTWSSLVSGMSFGSKPSAKSDSPRSRPCDLKSGSTGRTVRELKCLLIYRLPPWAPKLGTCWEP